MRGVLYRWISYILDKWHYSFKVFIPDGLVEKRTALMPSEIQNVQWRPGTRMSTLTSTRMLSNSTIFTVRDSKLSRDMGNKIPSTSNYRIDTRAPLSCTTLFELIKLIKMSFYMMPNICRNINNGIDFHPPPISCLWAGWQHESFV